MAEDPQPTLLCWPLDHYYSPIPDTRVLARQPARSRIWPASPPDTPGIDWREREQLELLHELAAQPELVLAEKPTDDPSEYHASNELFGPLDAWLLQGILRRFRPRRMIEVGSGWSSLVSARVNREHLDGELDLTCVEPYPPAFLEPELPGINRIVRMPVQELPTAMFLKLRANDVLFIDSSHVAKTGGDVGFLFGEVVPRLAPGVIVHVHDIFLPWDYPPEWVLSGRAWNELYLVRAFLTFNPVFRVTAAVQWLSTFHRETLAALLPGYPERYGAGGASLWIRRVD